MRLNGELINILALIPAPVWNVAAALVAFTGVIITIWVQGVRFTKQLKHDRALRDREREMMLRKDVYLALSEAISAAEETLVNFANPEFPDGDLTKAYFSKSSAFARAYVIATPNTYIALNAFSAQLLNAWARLEEFRRPAVALAETKTSHKQNIKRAEDDRSRILAKIEKQSAESFGPMNDDDGWNFHLLNLAYESIQREIREELRTLEEIGPKFQEASLALWEACREEGITLSRLGMYALLPIRVELELPFDEIDFKAMVENRLVRDRQTMIEALNSARRANRI